MAAAVGSSSRYLCREWLSGIQMIVMVHTNNGSISESLLSLDYIVSRERYGCVRSSQFEEGDFFSEPFSLSSLFILLLLCLYSLCMYSNLTIK